jgi:NADPH:quinone reductase-like Zn-dependent oxidoreductase
MKAIVYRRYGPPEVLRLEEIDKPIPKDNEVRLKVRAASVNPYDWHFMRGTPYMVRLIAGFPKPKFIGLGADVAGEVEAVGASVTQFKPGDHVFGSCRGAFAEYACAKESDLTAKPENLPFDQAGAVLIAALTALQGLRKGKIRAGQKVLVNGASGGVGTFAVQIAKSFAADVSGVTSTRNLELVRSIGADHVIDYTASDFTRSSNRYDLILDCVGNHSPSALRRVLAPGGICVGAGGATDVWLIGPIARTAQTTALSSLSDRKLVGILAKSNPQDLAILRDLLQSGKVTPVIDRRYPLHETPAAIRYLEAGHAHGKVVILPD